MWVQFEIDLDILENFRKGVFKGNFKICSMYEKLVGKFLIFNGMEVQKP
jgi:hypothetical protein